MKDRFDVFLCHNSEDKPEVKKIGNRLKDHGLHPWLDEWELRPGFPWQRLLEENIEKIEAAAVFIGPSGMGPWQQLELEAYLREFVNRKCPVIPVILKGAPKLPKLPLFLDGLTWVDFRQNEPDPLERLIWGITGERRGSRVAPAGNTLDQGPPARRRDPSLRQETSTTNAQSFPIPKSKLSGPFRVAFSRRLGNSWRDLAGYLNIPAFDQARFERGDEPRAILVWMENRGLLGKLKEALTFIDRQDLADLLDVD